MENDTRNLLIGIGQPGFSYRSFDEDDHGALLARWPLVALVAANADLRETPLGRHGRAGAGMPHRLRRAGPDEPRAAGFLDAYEPASTDRASGKPPADVRALLNRLSGDFL